MFKKIIFLLVLTININANPRDNLLLSGISGGGAFLSGLTSYQLAKWLITDNNVVSDYNYRLTTSGKLAAFLSSVGCIWLTVKLLDYSLSKLDIALDELDEDNADEI